MEGARGVGKYEVGALEGWAERAWLEVGGCEKALGWGVKTGSAVVMPRAVELPSSSSEISEQASSDAEEGGPEGWLSWW